MSLEYFNRASFGSGSEIRRELRVMRPQNPALGGAKTEASVLDVHREVIKGTQNVCSWSYQVQIISHCHAADALNVASREPI